MLVWGVCPSSSWQSSEVDISHCEVGGTLCEGGCLAITIGSVYINYPLASLDPRALKRAAWMWVRPNILYIYIYIRIMLYLKHPETIKFLEFSLSAGDVQTSLGGIRYAFSASGS